MGNAAGNSAAAQDILDRWEAAASTLSRIDTPDDPGPLQSILREAMMHAAEGGEGAGLDPDMRKALVDSDVTGNEVWEPQFSFGWTALHYACDGGKLNVVKWLASKAGADVEGVTKTGWTALHLACSSGRLPIVQYLVEEAGVFVDARDRDGWTPLHQACIEGHLDIVKYLIEHAAADKKAMDASGWRPLHIAARLNHVDIVNYLLRSGVPANARSTRAFEGFRAGSSAWDIAVQNGNKALAATIKTVVDAQAALTAAQLYHADEGAAVVAAAADSTTTAEAAAVAASGGATHGAPTTGGEATATSTSAESSESPSSATHDRSAEFEDVDLKPTHGASE